MSMENVAYIEAGDINPDGSLKPYVNNGKPVILMCQGSFCGYCTKAKPAFQKVANHYYKTKTVVCATILTDGSDSEKEAAKFIKRWNSKHQGVPEYLGFDKNGKFEKVYQGNRDENSLIKFGDSL